MNLGFLIFANMTQLDFTGPFEVLSRVPDAAVHVIAKDGALVRADSGLVFSPSTSLEACPALDLLLVPGGPGTLDVLNDPAALEFLSKQGARASYVTSVCTGALALGAAGLLEGYRATTHWAYLDLLPLVGAIPTNQRVVHDRNRITAGGVTAGIDFGFVVLAAIAGEAYAKSVQLQMEYDPEPPFRSGHPSVAEPALLESTRARLAPRLARYRERLASSAKRA